MKQAKGSSGELRTILCVEFDRRATPSEVSALKRALRESPNCIHSIEVTGGFDLIAEYAATGIGWYKTWLAELAEPFARVVNRYEVSFVFGRAPKRFIDEDAVWVPENGGFTRIDSKLIDKVVAEGDYVRIHSQDQSWMLHETMKSVFRRLPATDFIRVHRSTIVRFPFISRVVREDGHWVAHLLDGTKTPVARSHVLETLEVVRSRGRSFEDPDTQTRSAPIKVAQIEARSAMR
jgi:hypothetical protein